MKKTYRLHYRIFDGLTPEDRDRNYLLMTLLDPDSEAVKTLALDEDIFNKILKRCRTEEKQMKLKSLVYMAAHEAIKAGKSAGSFIINA